MVLRPKGTSHNERSVVIDRKVAPKSEKEKHIFDLLPVIWKNCSILRDTRFEISDRILLSRGRCLKVPRILTLA